jgi:hypothetical protein
MSASIGPSLDRRAALARLGALALATGTAVACGGVERTDLTGLPGTAADDPGATDDPLVGALGYAALASSAHNSQPWRVRREGTDRITLFGDPTRRLPAVDPTDREFTLSLGAFLENLAQASEAIGLDATITTVTDGDAVATVQFASRAPGSNAPAVLDAIRRRRIVRSGHRDTPLSAEHARVLVSTAGRAEWFVRGAREDTLLRDGTIEANRLQAARDDAQRELSEWIRFKDDDAHAKRDGLTPASMEITGVAGWWVRARYTAATVMTPAFRERGLATATEQAKAGGGWLVLTSDGGSREALLDAGRRYQRLLLTLRAIGVAAHPMTQMLEEPETRAGLEGSLGVDGTLQFLLRVGYVDRYPEPVSVRRPVAWFME